MARLRFAGLAVALAGCCGALVWSDETPHARGLVAPRSAEVAPRGRIVTAQAQGVATAIPSTGRVLQGLPPHPLKAVGEEPPLRRKAPSAPVVNQLLAPPAAPARDPPLDAASEAPPLALSLPARPVDPHPAVRTVVDNAPAQAIVHAPSAPKPSSGPAAEEASAPETQAMVISLPGLSLDEHGDPSTQPSIRFVPQPQSPNARRVAATPPSSPQPAAAVRHAAQLEELPPAQSSPTDYLPIEQSHEPLLVTEGGRLTSEGFMTDGEFELVDPSAMEFDYIAPEPWYGDGVHRAAPVFRQAVRGAVAQAGCCGPLSPIIQSVFGRIPGEPGLGVEQLALAPFEIEAAKPANLFRLRFDSAYDFRTPDRAEMFWAKLGGGKGPAKVLGQESVDYQDIRFQLSMGGPKFAVATEVPLRVLDPTLHPDTAGLGDLRLTTKTVFLEGKKWRVTQFLGNYFNTGSPKRGLGTGHISMEPGVLFDYRPRPDRQWNSEIRFFFPIAGDPVQAGNYLRYSLGVSQLLFDSDAFAIAGTLEAVAWSILEGKVTTPSGASGRVDGVDILHIYPGVRIITDPGGDLGVFDVGVSGTFLGANDGWYDSLFRLDMRWHF